MISPTDALQTLREGNRRFVAAETADGPVASRTHHVDMSAGQQPVATILACSDSRVPVELVFDQGFGDLFVIRVAGNIAAPSQIGSIEYAASALGTRLVVVLGHSNCGAIVSTLEEIAGRKTQRSPNLRAIIDRVRRAIEPVVAANSGGDEGALVEAAVRANIQASVERLAHGSLTLERMIDAGDLVIVGAKYSVATGAVEFFDEPQDKQTP